MAINTETVAKRLLMARNTLQYPANEVSHATGIGVERIAELESGSTRPTGDEILILANFYECEFINFLDENLPAPVQQAEILFRRYGEDFLPEDRRAVQEFLHLCQMEASLEKLLEQPPLPFTFKPTGSFFKGHGQQAAEALRETLGYSDKEAPRDIYGDFRRIGVHIFRRKLANKDISGLYIEDQMAGHCALINYSEDIYRQRFSAAHEVAHSIFDSSEGTVLTYNSRSKKYDKDDLLEIRANSFASNYLMPRKMLETLPPMDASSAQYWAQQFRVSTAALAKALRDAGLIDAAGARLIKSVRVSHTEKIDPEASGRLTESQRQRRTGLLARGLSNYYVDLAFRAYDKSAISTGRLAEILHVDHNELAGVSILFGRKIIHGV